MTFLGRVSKLLKMLQPFLILIGEEKTLNQKNTPHEKNNVKESCLMLLALKCGDWPRWPQLAGTGCVGVCWCAPSAVTAQHFVWDLCVRSGRSASGVALAALCCGSLFPMALPGSGVASSHPGEAPVLRKQVLRERLWLLCFSISCDLATVLLLLFPTDKLLWVSG